MKILQHALCLSLAVMLAGCATLATKKEEKLYLSPVAFAALPGWGADNAAAAVPALAWSCAKTLARGTEKSFGVGDYAGTVADWQAACAQVTTNPPPSDDAARKFFEDNFTPYSVSNDTGPDGLFTGYYEPLLRGSLEKKPPYLIPIYSRPDDLITVNLGDFKPSLKGETIMGRVVGENLVPYFARADIEKGAIDQKPKIVWVDNAVDAFFLHIQGSGVVQMEDGTTLQVGYAAQNGQTYYAIGQELIKRGELTKDNVSMQNIRAWLESHPDQAADVMNLNASYVFFRPLDGDGPLGAQGVALTPGRSLAVDRKKIPYGVPVWLDAESPDKTGRLQRLMVAQDTGGAITGAVRGDFFWGAGDEATHNAGIMKSAGRFYILLPKSVTVPPDRLKKSAGFSWPWGTR